MNAVKGGNKVGLTVALLCCGYLVAGTACYWMNAAVDAAMSFSLMLALVWVLVGWFYLGCCRQLVGRLLYLISITGFLVLPAKYVLMLLPYWLNQ